MSDFEEKIAATSKVPHFQAVALGPPASYQRMHQIMTGKAG
jgi:hypothetical protein